MSPIANNCDTDVRVHYQRFSDGVVLAQITAKATLPTTPEYVRVELNTENRLIFVEHGNTRHQALFRHTLPWSSAFPTKPTLGEMMETAESLARGEWFKLFPEEA